VREEGSGTKIEVFSQQHLHEARRLALSNYEEERRQVPMLPQVAQTPTLEDFSADGRGVVLCEGSRLLGFLCWYEPIELFFGLSYGIWSPPHSHATIEEGRSEIYDRLYQAMAERLVAENVFTHAVTLYAHDETAIRSFFDNGFGNRCIDAIRETTPQRAPLCEGISFRAAHEDDAAAIAPLNNGLQRHLNSSPTFMPFSHEYTAAEIVKRIAEGGTYRHTVAVRGDQVIAYLGVHEQGENFATEDESMFNITGAYTLPEYRSTGVSSALLEWTMARLREAGYARCGVDCESLNPTARKFWLKSFVPYTYTVVRRIDERYDWKVSNIGR